MGTPPNVTACRSLRVLVVDDNADAAAILAMILRFEGHSVRTATGGAEAIAALAEAAADLVFCDIVMPGMDGFEVARAVRAVPGLASVVLVALTGLDSEAEAERSREAGFDHHLVKPIEPSVIEELARRIGRLQERTGD
jgi:CheY-like chemotaxis protein